MTARTLKELEQIYLKIWSRVQDHEAELNQARRELDAARRAFYDHQRPGIEDLRFEVEYSDGHELAG